MILEKEKQIVYFIRFSPILLVLFVAFLIISILYVENKNSFIEEKKQIENNYFLENKRLVKDEVLRAYDYIKYKKMQTENQLKQNIKNRVYEAHFIAEGIYNNYKSFLKNDEILQLIKVALNEIRFNNQRGYYFIDDIHGNKLLHPIDKSIEGKNFLEYTDAKGYKFFKTIVQTIKDKSERFDEYYWYKPNTKGEIGRKISFYKYFEPLNIAIGTGEYVEDFENEIKKEALDYISKIRFENDGYIFVIDYEMNFLNHIDKSINEKNVTQLGYIKNLDETIEKIIDTAKNNLEFITYIQHEKPNLKTEVSKTSFVKAFDDWNWVIGSGFYEDDLFERIESKKKELNERFDEYLKNTIIICIILTIFLLVLSFYISRLLESKFNEYKNDLNKKQSILYQQSKMAAMGEMIANIAHQWRQPLSTITTVASGIGIQKQMGILSDDFLIDSTKKINASAQYLSKTIDDFRNFFSPDRIKSRFYLKNTFSMTLDLVSAQFYSKNIKIIKQIENIELYNYENELIQVLINILNNARDELVKLSDNEDRYIFIDAYKLENKVIIKIRDNAKGIGEEILDKIFEPYFTTKHKSQGTGIGLYMSEEIVTKHLNGKIEAKNKEYEYNNKKYFGAQFKIILEV